MRIMLAENVRDAAKRRIRWLFEEFDGSIIVNHSGGKDSTVIFNLALEVAHELGATPLKVCFMDSEAEWQATIDHMRDHVMYRDDVEPIWIQMPVTMYLGASSMMWFLAWDETARERWIHQQQPGAITSGFQAERFMELFGAYAKWAYPDTSVAKIIGIRAEESPARTFGVTTHEILKGETWGALEDKDRGHYTFSPIYDWSFSDVWKAIHDGGWEYNRLYDLYWRFGFPTRSMRVADLTSGDMSRNNLVLAELEPETYIRLQERMGAEALERMETRGWFPDGLPPMFGSWAEYRDYLLEHLIDNPDWREKMARRFASGLHRFKPDVHDAMIRMQVGAVLIGDYKGTKQQDFEAAHASDRLVRR